MALNPNPSKSKGVIEESKPSPWLGRILEVGVLVLGIGLVMLIRLAWLETAIVTSGSMEPTLRVGDRLLVDHRISLMGTWERGDVILFDAPEGWSGSGETLIKRVVALPGDVVAVQNGGVILNGQPVNEPYLPTSPPPGDAAPETLVAPPLKLLPGQYWVMGDNRWNSDDSRSNGPLPGEAIRGRLLRILVPLSRAGALSR
jgi:signal peptidase I